MIITTFDCSLLQKLLQTDYLTIITSFYTSLKQRSFEKKNKTGSLKVYSQNNESFDENKFKGLNEFENRKLRSIKQLRNIK